MPESPRALRRGASIALSVLMGLLVLATPAFVAPSQAAPGDAGYQDQSYAGGGTAPTADKPQSKLWYNDGLWWSDMFDTVTKTHHIFRLDRATEKWVDTGTQIDGRPSTRADLLSAGGHLYAASIVLAASSAANVANQPARLYRYTYNATTKKYTLDSGFPVAINNVSSESLTLDRDSTGVLWATWTQGQKVYVNSTVGSDSSWGTPAVLPVTGATGLEADDISALAAFGTNRVGLLWSNQVTSTFYFATHRDGDPATTWTRQVALSSPHIADDHMNLKQLEADPQGHVYAAVKTSLDGTGAPGTSPQVELLSYDIASGTWHSYVYGTLADCHTRPMIVIDSTNRVLHMFATAPASGGCPYTGSPGSIYEKTTSLDNPSFAPGRGTPVMQDTASPNLNNVTGTKQNVTAASGLVLMASNDATSRYWHADIPLGAPAPAVSFTESPATGVAPLSVQFTDTSTGNLTAWSWSFGDGSTSTLQNPTHTYTQPGTYTVTVTGTTASGATGSSSGTVTVSATPPTGGHVTFGSATSRTASTATTAVTLAKPANSAVGDVVVASFTADNAPTVASVPTGWTSALPRTLRAGPGATLFAYYHVVDASDATRTGWTWTLSSAQKWGGGATRYVGVDTAHPIDTTVSTATSATATGTTITVPGVTTATPGAMLIGGLGADGSTPTTTPPTGWTEAFDSTGGQLGEQAYLGQSAAGPTGSRTWTVSQGRSIAAWMTALRAAS